TRFENEDGMAGTNPEELIAAAHAGCFNMAMSFQIAGEGFTADELKTIATVTLDSQDGGFAITDITLDLKGRVAGMEKAQFEKLAQIAKENCPISKALSSVPMSLHIAFEAGYRLAAPAFSCWSAYFCLQKFFQIIFPSNYPKPLYYIIYSLEIVYSYQ